MKKLKLLGSMVLFAFLAGAQNVTAELGSGSDLNTYTNVGWFLQYDGNIGKNYPPERSSGILLVTGENGAPTGWVQGLRYQTYQTTGGHVYVRTLFNNGLSWTNWNLLTTADVLTAAIQAVGNLPSSGDLNTFNTPGRFCEWDNNNFAGSANFPEQVSGLLTVTTNPGAVPNSIQDRRYQTYQTASGHIYARSFFPGSGWAPMWAQVNGTAASQWLTGGSDISYSTGNVGIGTTSPTGKLQVAGSHSNGVMQDGNDRPSMAVTGAYPQVVMMAGGSGNTNHGAILMLGSYDAGTSGAHKHWSIGTSGQNSTFLDIGYHAGADINPHAGIRNYNGSTFMTILNSGNVGIGTTTPSSKLEVLSSTDGSQLTPSTQTSILTLKTPYTGNPYLPSGAGYKWGIKFSGSPDNSQGELKSASVFAVSEDAGSGFNRSVGLAFHTSGGDQPQQERMRITNTGNVGIGTTSPQAQLHVTGSVLVGTPTATNVYTSGKYLMDIKGNARADKLTVNTTGADFVFEPSYDLKPLAEVEKYVKQNKHLPGIAPAAEMQKNGIEVGEQQAKLLQKLEELTLYIIQQSNNIKAQDMKIMAQEKRIAELENKAKK